jgi:hypothetical protein
LRASSGHARVENNHLQIRTGHRQHDQVSRVALQMDGGRHVFRGAAKVAKADQIENALRETRGPGIEEVEGSDNRCDGRNFQRA